jgi:hypothetical protein
MGRNRRIKAQRRDERRTHRLPPCSYQHCANGRPPGSHLIRKMTEGGEFLTACDGCLEPMVAAVRGQGIDAQVIPRSALALAQLNEKAARRHRKGP